MKSPRLAFLLVLSLSAVFIAWGWMQGTGQSGIPRSEIPKAGLYVPTRAITEGRGSGIIETEGLVKVANGIVLKHPRPYPMNIFQG